MSCKGSIRLLCPTPFGLGVELDALYRHLNYASSSAATTANAWEFPLLAKYRFKAPLVRPFVDAGVAWDTLEGIKQSIRKAVADSRHDQHFFRIASRARIVRNFSAFEANRARDRALGFISPVRAHQNRAA